MTQVRPLVAVLTSHTELLDEIVSILTAHLGHADFIGPWHPFIHTHYYEPEMGGGLKRCIVSFEKVVSAGKLPEIKARTREIEDKYRVDGKRTVNLDPGYVDLHKVVLGSGKGGGHMIFVGQGVSVDMLLWFNKGWQPLPWAYPDFKDGTYFKELEDIRSKLKDQIHH